MTKKLKKKPAKAGKTKKLIIQFAEYMVTGGVWFWSGYVIIVTLDDHIGLFWANLIGNGVGITLNFLLSRYWVFKTKKKSGNSEKAWRYIVYTALNAFLLNYLILYGLQSGFGIDPVIGQFVASGFFTIWNFVWYKLWVFKDHPSPPKKTKARP
jgi:putative flippase GtrA